MENPVIENFSRIRLKIASPEDILRWSYGEVTKPETINYRTQRPEKDGLFSERIFGPTKDWECYCGKYRRIRYKGVVCDKCGVEVTRAIVRRERMGHINLAAPVCHIWFLRSVPSKIGLVLDVPVQRLERVIYYAAYIVTKVHEENRKRVLDELERELSARKKTAKKEKKESVAELRTAASKTRAELESLQKGKVLIESEYHALSRKFADVFEAGSGASAVRQILEQVDLEKEVKKVEAQIGKGALTRSRSQAKAKAEARTQDTTAERRLLRRLKLLRRMAKAGIRPEWMIMTALPILPPDLRPMVPLDGGRYATSDLNDLYRSVINRNNRLKKLLELKAPEIIIRNEKRMLQEAVDALFDNGRHGKAVLGPGNRPLKSLADMLKGKQGRFRQNLLGKRVDYSGRSVIVVGPELKLNECGLPKDMAMKLFKPFVIGEIIRRELAHNVKAAERLVQEGAKEVWDILEEVIQDKYVLLNRAPTLHRLGIQAYKPTLIEGLAIQLHPLSCSAFNADFDGDQMAVHVPLSEKAQEEARTLMAASTNVLKPSAGEPIINPEQDMVLGCYFLTVVFDGKKGEGMVFSSPDEAFLAYDHGIVDLQAKIKVRVSKLTEESVEIIDTSIGRLFFQEVVPKKLGWINDAMTKKKLRSILAHTLEVLGEKETVLFADRIKDLGFKYATVSGLSFAASDLLVPKEREMLLKEANEKIRRLNNFYWKGFITADERYMNAIKLWSETKNVIGKFISDTFEKDLENNVTYQVNSGARGNWGQVTQLSGMKGLVANPSGRTIELPIQSNLKGGFSVLEYFIATHGGRKGKSDTALKTAEAGYLTRRLVDAVQDVLIREL